MAPRSERVVLWAKAFWGLLSHPIIVLVYLLLQGPRWSQVAGLGVSVESLILGVLTGMAFLWYTIAEVVHLKLTNPQAPIWDILKDCPLRDFNTAFGAWRESREGTIHDKTQ